jgi:spermidine/putrescine transport system substrate-binding protein
MDARKSRLNAGQPPRSSTRRQFLQVSAAALSGIALANCRTQLADVSSSQNAHTNGSANNKTLHVYSWSNYFDDELLKVFTQNTGIQVIADVFDSNETMLSKLQAGGGGAYSIIYPSDYMVQQMLDLKMLLPLDQSKLQGLSNLIEKFQNPKYDADNRHSVPATWGTTGLVYNTKLNPAPQDWEYLWQQKGQLARKMTLFNDVREVMGATLRSLGYSYNSTNPDQIKQAYQKLVQLKPALSSFTTDGWRDQLVTGDLVLAMAYSSDAIDIISQNPGLKYVIPASGSSLWTDTMAIPKTAPNPEAAYAWINFILEPTNAAQMVERLKFATPNQAAIEQLSPELKSNVNLFPPEEILSKCEGVAPVGSATEIYDRYWTQLTSG